MSVSSVEGKAAAVPVVSDVAWSDGVELTPAQIHEAHRRALRQAGRRLRSRVEEAGAMGRPGAPSPETPGRA